MWWLELSVRRTSCSDLRTYMGDFSTPVGFSKALGRIDSSFDT